MIKNMKKIDLMFILLILAFALLYGTVIFNDSLWGDEAYTMLTIKKFFLRNPKNYSTEMFILHFIILLPKFLLYVWGDSVPVVKNSIHCSTNFNDVFCLDKIEKIIWKKCKFYFFI